jgi:hypothetical protein
VVHTGPAYCLLDGRAVSIGGAGGFGCVVVSVRLGRYSAPVCPHPVRSRLPAQTIRALAKIRFVINMVKL